MQVLKAFLFLSLLYLSAGAEDHSLVPPGPSGNNSTSTVVPPITIPTPATTTTSKPTTTSTTPKPTTPSTTTTTTTSKPTTPSTTTTTSTTQKPTTASTTTAKPTTPTPVNPIGKWAVNYANTNRTCLVLEAELSIAINYKENNTTKNVTVQIPSTATVQGQCGDQAENLTLRTDFPTAMSFNFKKSSDGKRFDVESVIVMVNVSIPGQKGPLPLTFAHNKTEFSTPVSNSYKCTKEQKFTLLSQTNKDFDGVLLVSHLQVQAFRNSSSTKFDDAMDCASSETPDVVPIAVGCALAALVIIVLIAYLIGRRRSQARGYLSM